MSKIAASVQVLQSLSDALSQIVESVSPSVVSVGQGRRSASGVIWTSDGYIVTCSHVLRSERPVIVTFADGSEHEAKIIGQDPYSDVALLKIDGTFKAIEVGDSKPVRVGEFVLALANPLGKTPAATSGIITSARASLRGWWLENVIATDARLNPGYSGGPLVNVSGKMIGLNSAYVWQRGIAIPVNTLKRIAETLTREGRIKRGYLGIITRPMLLPREIATRADVNQTEALMVLTVEPASPAKNAGLALGDIMLRLGTEPVGSVYDLHKALGQDLIGRASKLTVLRGERILELSVTPGEAQD